jgi:hypothetical protein
MHKSKFIQIKADQLTKRLTKSGTSVVYRCRMPSKKHCGEGLMSTTSTQTVGTSDWCVLFTLACFPTVTL